MGDIIVKDNDNTGCGIQPMSNMIHTLTLKTIAVRHVCKTLRTLQLIKKH